MSYDSTIDTTLHITRVRFLVGQCAIILLERGAKHDASKLEEPERAIFDTVGNRLAVITYAGEEYQHSLAELKTALDHHTPQCPSSRTLSQWCRRNVAFRSHRNVNGLESGRRAGSRWDESRSLCRNQQRPLFGG